MILLIDNYDSFSYNLYQLIGSVEKDIKVIRNDEYTIEEIEEMAPEALILSPGPGKPADAGVCIDAVKYFAGKLFRGLGPEFKAARYHSLAAEAESLPAELKVVAEADDGEIMALEHAEYPIFGVQFHPESVMTPDGRKMIENFMEVVRND